MLLYDIYKILHEVEEYNYDSEANSLYYVVTYVDNQVIIYQIEDYHFDGDNWGEIDVKSTKTKIENIDVPIEEYLQAVCMYANNMAHPNGKEIMEYEYPYVSHSVEFQQGQI